MDPPPSVRPAWTIMPPLPLHFFAPLFVIVVALGILGEPSSKYTLFLQKHFVYTPQAAKSKASDDDGDRIVIDEE